MQNYDEVIRLVNQPSFKISKIKAKNNPFKINKYKKNLQNKFDKPNKENQQQNSVTNKEKKFMLFKVINDVRKSKNPQKNEMSLQLFKYFEKKDNLLKLLSSKYDLYQKRCLKFRQYNKDKEFVPEEIEKSKLYFKVRNSCALLVKNILVDNGFKETKSNQKAILVWSNGSIKLDCYQKLQQHQKINHHPYSNQITRKDFLFINFMKIKQKFKNHFDFVPNSYLLPQDINSFMRDFQLKNQQMIMICKPVASSQGKGIFLEQNPDTVNQKDFAKKQKWKVHCE